MDGTLEQLREHELIILRRLRRHPLTEFELACEVAENLPYSNEEAAARMEPWLESLKTAGLVWSGKLYSATGQSIMAAALTRAGRELVG